MVVPASLWHLAVKCSPSIHTRQGSRPGRRRLWRTCMASWRSNLKSLACELATGLHNIYCACASTAPFVYTRKECARWGRAAQWVWGCDPGGTPSADRLRQWRYAGGALLASPSSWAPDVAGSLRFAVASSMLRAIYTLWIHRFLAASHTREGGGCM
jgi:hypothetical protein